MNRDLGTQGGRVSVVVSTLNGIRHVREQLDSIAAQTLPPVEILVGDDGSTDGTLHEVSRFAETTDIPVRVTAHESRLGYAENFIRGALAAQGDLVAFADQDDVWYPHKLETAVAALTDPELMLWVSGWRTVDENLVPVPDRRFHTGLVQRSSLAYPLHVAHGARMVFRASLLHYLDPRVRARSVYGPRPAHHDEWILFAAHVLGTVTWHPEPLMMYRRHDTAVSAQWPSIPTPGDLLGRVGEAPNDAVAEAARDRARYLRERAETPECAPVRDRLLAGAGYYEQLTPRLVRRVRTQTSPRRPDRAAGLVDGVVRGDYLPLRRGGLGLWNLLQDSYALTRLDADAVIEPIRRSRRRIAR